MPGHVLVVDDEAVTRELVRGALSAAGYTIATAADGKNALSMLNAGSFDAMVSDLRMPQMEGLTLLAAARASVDDLQVVVITGYASLDAVLSALREGACDFVQKPFVLADLVERVDRAVERARSRRSTALYEASQRIISAAESSQLPATIVDVTMQAMSADDVSLMLHEPGKGLYIAYSHGLSREIQNAGYLAIGERIAGRVAASRKPLLLNGDSRDQEGFSDLVSFHRVQSSIVYPLCRGEDLVGILNISRSTNPRPYHQQDVERASILAAQVLLALENCRLMRQLVGTERLVAVGQVAAGVAHEINNPLSFVSASLESLTVDLAAVAEIRDVLATSTDAQVRAAWERIERDDSLQMALAALRDAVSGTNRIRDIVGDLRSLARREPAHEATIDANEALRSALRIAGSEIARKATLETSFVEGVWVKADTGRLAQVFLNLLINAAQALSSERRAENRIRASTALRGMEVVVSITDNGRGIEPGHRQMLFRPFFTTKPPETGTGLGLSISREIVRGYGGDIEVTSAVGKGSTFSVGLPLVVGGPSKQ